VWGYERTTKAATQQRDYAVFVSSLCAVGLYEGGSEEFGPSLCVVGLDPVVALARVLIHEVFREEELAERRPKFKAPITPGSRSKSTARGTHLPSRASLWEELHAGNALV
jgi:hypothetical protein